MSAPPLRVLYVDDDDDIRTIVAMALALDAGIELRSYASGEAALAAVDDDPWRPDLVMLDVTMPGMDGLTLATALRARRDFGAARFAFITARSRKQDVTALVDAGADAVILKPFDPLTLAEQVRAAA